MTDRMSESAGLPACLIVRCCSCVCSCFVLVSVLSWLVLVPCFSSRDFLLRLNQSHPPLFLFRPNTYAGTCMSIEPLKAQEVYRVTLWTPHGLAIRRE